MSQRLLVLGLISSLSFACGGGSKGQTQTAAVPLPPAQPAPAASPPPAPPAPAPEAAPPTPDRRGEVVALLDEIDRQLRECAEHKMKNVGKHAAAIQEAAAKLAGPLQQFPGAAPLQPEIHAQAVKFVDAAQHGQHGDLHNHHHRLEELVRRIRETL